MHFQLPGCGCFLRNVAAACLSERRDRSRDHMSQPPPAITSMMHAHASGTVRGVTPSLYVVGETIKDRDNIPATTIVVIPKAGRHEDGRIRPFPLFRVSFAAVA